MMFAVTGTAAGAGRATDRTEAALSALVLAPGVRYDRRTRRWASA
jgi:hypothetical protein